MLIWIAEQVNCIDGEFIYGHQTRDVTSLSITEQKYPDNQRIVAEYRGLKKKYFKHFIK